MTDYISIITALFGSGSIFLVILIVLVVIFGALNGVRGEIIKFYLFIFILGLSYLTTIFVKTIVIIAFCFYYGHKIYKGVQRQ
jgi:hypothetical protein